MINEHFLEGVKQELITAIKCYAKRHQMTQSDMALLVGTSQPRMSDLFRGKLEKFSVDQLMKWAYDLGINITLTAI